MPFRVRGISINFTVSDNFLFLSWALGLGETMAVNYSRSLMLLSAVRLSCRHTLFVVVVGFCASSWSSVWNLPGKAYWEYECGMQLKRLKYVQLET